MPVQHILLAETFPCISHLYCNLLFMVDLRVWEPFCWAWKAFKGQNHLFNFPTHLLPQHPSFQRENIRKFGESDAVHKPVSIRKVSYPAGHGVQPLVPAFQLSFLSGNPDFRGRKSPNDPCTYHWKNGGCLKKGVYLTCMASSLHLYSPTAHVTNNDGYYRRAMWDAHWEGKLLFL